MNRASTPRLLRDQGKRTESRGLLASLHAWFTGDFDTRDRIKAKALLRELSKRSPCSISKAERFA